MKKIKTHGRINAWLILFLYLCLAQVNTSEAEQKNIDMPGLELDEIVVTATRDSHSVDTIAKNVTVITARDIEQSTAGNIVELLGREANLNLRSTTGNEGKAGVDIRGMGDTYVSNVIVMVDGIKMNPSDMSGADFLSVPLGQVERIEIVRGGSAVMYGDGAVGGVINVITKKTEQPFSAKVSGRYGSFQSYKTRLYTGVKQKALSFNISSGYSDSEGYRDNGDLRKKDAKISAGYDPGDSFRLKLEASVVDSFIGLPGPVSHQAERSRDERRSTNFPNDFSQTIDRRYVAKLQADILSGVFTIKGNLRNRDNDYVIGYSEILSEAEQTDTITEDSAGLNLLYDREWSWGSINHNLMAGVDYYESDYTREDLNAEKKKGEIQTIECFIHDELSWNNEVTINLGYRHSWFSGVFQDENYEDFFSDPVLPPPVFIPPQHLYSEYVPEEERKKDWKNLAYEIGMTWQAFKKTTLFVSHSRSYRIPNVDEFALSDEDLSPQTSYHCDTGFRAKLGNAAELSATGFWILTKDEIYYGEEPRRNCNYDQNTIRKGIETDIKIYPLDEVYIWANYSYTHATFEQNGAFIPLVPEHMGNIGAEWYPAEGLTIALSGTFSGPRFDGNDLNNIADDLVLGSYQVYDAKIIWKDDCFRIFAGINNLLDTLYVTSAYSGSGYPMPTRSFYFGAEWVF